MYPFIQILKYQVSTYGLLAALGIGLAIVLGVCRGKRYGLGQDDVFYAWIYAVIGMLIGAKLLYLITVLPALWEGREAIAANPASLYQLFTGGFVFYGGVLGGLIGGLIYCRQFKLPVLSLFDAVAPGIPLAHAFGRVGCLLAGCCYGREYEGLCALTFPAGSVAPAGVSLFPSQPIETVLNLGLCGFLLLMSRKIKIKGGLMAIYLIAYSVLRFILEFFRGDKIRGAMLLLSTSQWIGIVLVTSALVFIFCSLKRQKPGLGGS